jgi:hypothetical protein
MKEQAILGCRFLVVPLPPVASELPGRMIVRAVASEAFESATNSAKKHLSLGSLSVSCLDGLVPVFR